MDTYLVQSAAVLKGFWRGVEGGQPPCGCRAALQDIQAPAKREHRPDQLRQIEREAGQLAQGDGVIQIAPATHAQRQQRRRRECNEHHRIKGRLQLLDAIIDGFGGGGTLRESCAFILQQGMASEHANAGEGFLGLVIQVREALQRFAETLSDPS